MLSRQKTEVAYNFESSVAIFHQGHENSIAEPVMLILKTNYSYLKSETYLYIIIIQLIYKY